MTRLRHYWTQTKLGATTSCGPQRLNNDKLAVHGRFYFAKRMQYILFSILFTFRHCDDALPFHVEEEGRSGKSSAGAVYVQVKDAN